MHLRGCPNGSDGCGGIRACCAWNRSGGGGRGGEGSCFYFYFSTVILFSLFFTIFLFHLSAISSTPFSPFSGRWHKISLKGWHVIKQQHSQTRLLGVYCVDIHYGRLVKQNKLFTVFFVIQVNKWSLFLSVREHRKSYLIDWYGINSQYSDRSTWANSVDSDQTPQIAASDQGLHCLPLIQRVRHSSNGWQNGYVWMSRTVMVRG